MTRWVSFLLLSILMFGCDSRSPDELNAHDLALHNRAMGLMGQYKYDEARQQLAALIQTHPEHPDLQVDLAIAILNRQREGDEAVALEIVSKVLQQLPNHQRALYTSGLLELNAGRALRAELSFRQVVEADERDAFAAYYLALSLAQQDRHEEALHWYNKAIELDPHLRSAYYGGFQVLRQLDRADEARELLGMYQKLATNPRARQAEFKYTRMGPKAEVRAFETFASGSEDAPVGPVFAARRPMKGAQRVRGTPEGRVNLSAADIDGDGHTDIFVAGTTDTRNAVLLNTADGGFVASPEHPLAAVGQVNTALWGDIDNDGLLDAYLCRRGPNQLWRQTALGMWRDSSSVVTANGDRDTLDGALFDADHDGDLDLFLVNADGPNELLNNNRDGTFRALAQELGIAGNGRGRSVLVADLDRDRDADLLVLNPEPPHEVYLNELLWRYREAPGFDNLRHAPLVAALAQDRDADGAPDLYALSAAGVQLWRADTQGQWDATVLSSVAPGSNPALALMDLDGDGAVDLLRSTPRGWGAYRITNNHLVPLTEITVPGLRYWHPFIDDVAAGPAVLGLHDAGLSVWPPGPGRHPFIGLDFSGMNDAGESMRSNASGIGVHMALRTGARWTVQDSFRKFSGPGQSQQPVTIGLGGAERADFVAVEWSDGVFQTELDLESGRLHAITETQRQLSSCPVLFAWDGEGYQFISDILGVGGIGFAVGRGEYAKPRPWEDFQLPNGLLQTRGGRYLLKLTEPMEEACYLDAVRLTAYDLPSGWHMVLDERMSIMGPEPSGEPRFYRTEILPIRATNASGDVTSAVTDADHKAAPVGALDPRFIGRLRGEHSLDLVFPRPLDAHVGEPMLVIDGWVEYPYSQTMFAAWQAGAEYLAPSLDFLDNDGQWHPLLDQFGYPAGMPRRISVPLAGLPAGVTRLRLRTNQEIYWDRIAVAYAEPLQELKRVTLPLHNARVKASGFPLRSTSAQRLPHYDYHRRAPLWDTRHMAGYYTEFGAVDALVAEADDALVIFGPGEEVHLEFDAAVEALPVGWTRTFVLETDGWAKDMDLFTRDGNTLEPLPAKRSSTGQRDRVHARFNTRYRSGT